MPTVIGIQVKQTPGQSGVEVTYSCEAIVDGPDDAFKQGGEVYKLLDAFEDGFKADEDDGDDD